MTNRLRMAPIFTVQRITAALVVLIVGFWLLSAITLLQVSTLYLVWVIVTILVVRSVPVQPGHWLARRDVRRLLVGAIAVGLGFLTLIEVGHDNNAAGPFLLMGLALGFVILGRATQRVASAPEANLDERQESLRNRAHRLAYWILAVLVTGTVLVSYLATPDSRTWLQASVYHGPVFTFILLLLFMPAMVLAWLEPDRYTGADAPRLAMTPAARVALAMVAIAFLTPLVLSLTFLLGDRVTSWTDTQVSSADASVRCTYFEARRQLGLGFGAVLPISGEVCWDGKKASEDWGLNVSDCNPYRTEMAIVERLECTRTTDAQGTLHFTYRARVRSALLPFLARDATMTLAVAGNGKVLRFP